MSTLNTAALDRIIARLGRIAEPDLLPMGRDLGAVIVEDNRAGVLSGTNRLGQAVSPDLKYRGGAGKATGFRKRNVKNGLGTTNLGAFKGFGDAKSGQLPNNNLTTAAYKRLTGPFAAPRRTQSRIITNLRERAPRMEGDLLIVEAGWVDVVDADGRPFLGRLFAPAGRDMRGVRPEGRHKAVLIAKQWVLTRIREGG